MSIDFCKAPDGATHYVVTGRGPLWLFPGGYEMLHRVVEGTSITTGRMDGDPGVHRVPTIEPFTSCEDAQTIGSKHDSGKPLMGAVPPNALLAVAGVLTFGAQKYGRDNWHQVENLETRYMDAALRHINAYQRGEQLDPESGENHLAHAVCSLMFILEKEGGK